MARKFIDVYPDKVYLWDSEKNNVNIEDIYAGDNVSVYYFKCSKGHSFRNTPYRVGIAKREGCKYCQGVKRTAIEDSSFSVLASKYLEYWDYSKNKFSPEDISVNNNSQEIWFKCKEGHSYKYVATMAIENECKCPICENGNLVSKDNIIYHGLFDKINKYWSDDLNNMSLLDRSIVVTGKYNFVCEKGHVFQKSIKQIREYIENGYSVCPVCSNTKLLSTVNDLKTKYPDVAELFDESKNNVSSSAVKYNDSKRKYWFKCKNGHSFQTYIHNVHKSLINSNGNTCYCPVCCGKEILKGYNDFESQHPELMYLWDWEKNNILPSEISCKDNSRKVWLRCSKGHSYKTYIASLIRSNQESCPYCSGRQSSINKKHGLLIDEYPDIAKLYDEANTVSLSTLTSGSSGKYYFHCENGHFYSQDLATVIASRNSTKGCPICRGRIIQPGFNDFESQHPELMYLWDWEKNDILPSEISCKDNSRKVWLKCSNGHSYQTYIDSLVRSHFECCIYCASEQNQSYGQLELYKILEENKIEYISEYALPSKKRLDAYIPSKKIGIEYNGIYWHNENHVGKDYHREKYLECNELGIQLIIIWEDDWNNKRDIITKMLLKKLGFLEERKVNARDCTVVSVSQWLTKNFMNENHIQGYTSGSYYIGLQDKDLNIVAIIICKVDKDNLNIVRYATSCNVRGGFSKLVKYIENTYNYTMLYTFSDNMVSDGSLYKNNGFKFLYEIPEDYMYVYQDTRYHKFNFRKDRFEKDPNLYWESNLTERELADINNISRVWDAGKIKWVKYKED